MRQTASRILVMGAALLSATPAAGAPPDEGAAVPLLPPSPGSVALPPSPMPPSAWSADPQGFPPGGPIKPRRRWYGWQILLPVIASDLAGAFALFLTLGHEFTAAGPPVFVASAIGHGLSGPIVHLAHGNIGKAGASFLLNAALPAAALGTNLASFNICDSNSRSGGSCYIPTVFIFFASIPATFVGALIVDTAVLAIEDDKRSPAAAQGPGDASFSLAPLLVPPLRSDRGMAAAWQEGWGREVPVGLSLVGRF
jgi:hypothetical protein